MNNKLKQLEKLVNINDPVRVYEEFEKIEQKTEELEKKDKELSSEIDDVSKIQNALKTALDDTSKEIDQLEQKKLSRDEFEAIQPTLKGDKGDDYCLTIQDKEEIAQKVKVPIVEKIIEKTEIKQPIIKEVAVADTPAQIRDKLEELNDDNRLAISAIHNLEKILDELRNKIGGRVTGGFSKVAMDFHIIDDETPSGAVNGTNKIFTLASIPNPLTSLKVYVNGQRVKVTEDYTISGLIITFVFAPPTSSILLCDYRI